jgi:WD40 repeat protein
MSVGIALEREAMITAVFSPTSDSMLTYADGFDGFTGFRLWDSRTGRLICRMPGDYTLLAGLKFDPTGRQVVALRAAPASTTASGQGAADAFVMAFWDAKNCTRLEREIRIEILEGEDTFASFGFFESGRTLAVKVGERRLLYDATTLQTHPAQQIVPAAPPPGLALLEDAEESSAGSEDPLSVRARHGDHAVVDVDGAPHTYLKHGERIVIDFGLEIVKAAFSPDGKSLVLSTDGVTHLMPAPSVWSQRLCAMLGERPTEDSLKDLRPEDIAYVDPCTP